ncbi:hypothetical protein [Amycolatopsis sp. cmx-4-68]|uniref:hypothetical protein n=1 Tax=Amycolatopsis sp. cmx-4-68 TaxID=2790938 RepID=UPI003979E55C
MILPNIPPAVYDARPLLKDVRTEAHRRATAADAVLWAFLVMAAAEVPAFVSVETGIGAPVRPTLYAVLAGASGTGKSAAWSTARALFGGRLEPFPLSTGEGVVEAFYGRVQREQPQGEGKPPKLAWVRERTRSNALFWLDEGETLFRNMEKSGNTTGTVLRAFWSGGTVGQKNATEGLDRVLDAGTYTGGLVIGLQPDISGALLADTSTGTAQRFVWASSTDVHAQEAPAPPLGFTTPVPTTPLARPWPPGVTLPGTLEQWATGETDAPEPVSMTVAPDISAELRAHRQGILTGRVEPDEHDTQRPAMRVKAAGVLAWLDGRMNVSAEDWELAAELLSASDRVRDALLEHAAATDDEQVATEGARRAQLRHAESVTEVVKLKERCGERVMALVEQSGPISASALRKRLSKPQRPFLADLLAFCTEKGIFTVTERDYNGQPGSYYVKA